MRAHLEQALESNIHLKHTALRCTCQPGQEGEGTGPAQRVGVQRMLLGLGSRPGPGVVTQEYGHYLYPDVDREDDCLGEAARVHATGASASSA